VIGFGASPEGYALYVAAFRQGSQQAGFEGQNVAIEYRWAEGQYERLRPTWFGSRRPFLKSAPDSVTQMGSFPSTARSNSLSGETGVECRETEFARRPPRGRSGSLGCCGCVTNTHDARARHEGHTYRDDRGEHQRPISGSPPWRGERGADHLLPAHEL